MTEAGVCSRSDLPRGALLHMVAKPDGAWCMCSNFCGLNNVTLPNIWEFLRLAGNCYFTTFDLTKAYWQVQVSLLSKAKTAVITPFVTFQFNVMLFEIKNAGSTFQQLIDMYMEGLPFVFCYMDYLLVNSPFFKEPQGACEGSAVQTTQLLACLQPPKVIILPDIHQVPQAPHQ